METARIRRQGYAVRLPFATFVERYKVVSFELTAALEPSAAACEQILAAAGLDGWQIGKTKVFLRYQHESALVELLAGYNAHASVISRAWRRKKRLNRWHAMVDVLRRRLAGD
jgi:myosin-3